MPRKTIEDLRSEFADSKFIFVHQDSNWADEMDVHGYKVFTKTEFNELLDTLEKINFPVTRYFGTNEEDEIPSLEDYLYDLRCKKITQVEYEAFISMFGSTKAGKFWIPDPSGNEDDW